MGIKELFNRFRELKTSRKISLLLIITILAFAQTVGILSIIAVSSLQNIIASIKIPYGAIYLNIGVQNPENMKANIPYYIQNQGIFGLYDLYMESEIYINYIDQLSSKNITSRIFFKADELPNCKAFSALTGNFSGAFSYFNVTAILDFIENYDFEKPFKFLFDIRFRACYFFNLIKFSIVLNSIDLTGE
jgi:hypothetical protein